MELSFFSTWRPIKQILSKLYLDDLERLVGFSLFPAEIQYPVPAFNQLPTCMDLLDLDFIGVKTMESSSSSSAFTSGATKIMPAIAPMKSNRVRIR